MTTTKSPTTFELDVSDVWCPECGVAPGEPCLGNNGKPYKSRTFHEPRFASRDQFVERATGTSETARWWRWKLRTDGPTRPPKPHGTMAAYQAHKRDGTEPCAECTTAAKDYWTAQNERLRASKKAKRDQAKLEKTK